MIRRAQCARHVALGLLALVLSACGDAGGTFGFSATPTIYDLTQQPQEFAGKEVTAQGYYLWKPGDPGMSVLLPGLSTADGTRDAQPIYASVSCNDSGACEASTETVGEPSTGAVWLENFPAEVTAELHRPGDSVWGVVEVTGTFGADGGYGPDGIYRYQLDVKDARALQKVERVVSAVEDEPLGEGKVSIFELAANAEQYNGQKISSRGYYFWSPATQGTFAEKVERELTPGNAEELAPLPAGIVMSMEGFPPEQSSALRVGPDGSFVWGLVEVTGTFETGSFGDGRYDARINVESVQVLEQPR